MKQKKITLSEIVGKDFYSVHSDILQGGHTHYWLKGGRGSTKSSFVSIEIILGLLADKNANAVVLRKVAVNLKDSVFEQLKWAIQALGVGEYWEVKGSIPELVYKKTGQRILFRGADNPQKLKSIKFGHGYAKYIWYEEVDEFSGAAEIRSINQSLMRGGKQFFVFYTYNPPKSQKNWVNLEVMQERKDMLVHHSTYLGVPPNWLGEQFFIEAEYMKKVNATAYRHEYLGEVVGSGGEVFTNVTIRQISLEEEKNFTNISRGLDWGYAVDPLHYTVNHYDSKKRRLYIFFEIHERGMTNRKAAQLIMQENKENKEIIADSAEPKSIAEFAEYGMRIIPAKKGPDSVDYGIKWLQDLEEIIIDPIRCPHTAREFAKYELEKDAQGGFRAKFPDKDNHSIDAVRYSREGDMRRLRIR